MSQRNWRYRTLTPGFAEDSPGSRADDRPRRPRNGLGQADALAPLNPALSPNGRLVAFSRVESSATDIWSLDTERGVLERLTSGDGVDTFPVWSRAGSHVIFRRTGPGTDGTGDIVETAMGGTRLVPPRTMASLGTPQDISSDGRFLLTRRGTADSADLWAEPLVEAGEAIAVATTAFAEYNAVFSPDGRWVAYQTTESGRSEVVVQRFPEPLDRTRVSAEGGGQPQWSRDGRAFYYIALDGRLVRAVFEPATHGPPRIGVAEPKFLTHIGGALQGTFRAQCAVSPDGRRFLMNTLVEESDLAPMTVVMRRK